MTFQNCIKKLYEFSGIPRYLEKYWIFWMPQVFFTELNIWRLKPFITQIVVINKKGQYF